MKIKLNIPDLLPKVKLASLTQEEENIESATLLRQIFIDAINQDETYNPFAAQSFDRRIYNLFLELKEFLEEHPDDEPENSVTITLLNITKQVLDHIKTLNNNNDVTLNNIKAHIINNDYINIIDDILSSINREPILSTQPLSPQTHYAEEGGEKLTTKLAPIETESLQAAFEHQKSLQNGLSFSKASAQVNSLESAIKKTNAQMPNNSLQSINPDKQTNAQNTITAFYKLPAIIHTLDDPIKSFYYICQEFRAKAQNLAKLRYIQEFIADIDDAEIISDALQKLPEIQLQFTEKTKSGDLKKQAHAKIETLIKKINRTDDETKCIRLFTDTTVSKQDAELIVKGKKDKELFKVRTLDGNKLKLICNVGSNDIEEWDKALNLLIWQRKSLLQSNPKNKSLKIKGHAGPEKLLRLYQLALQNNLIPEFSKEHLDSINDNLHKIYLYELLSCNKSLKPAEENKLNELKQDADILSYQGKKINSQLNPQKTIMSDNQEQILSIIKAILKPKIASKPRI